MDKHELADILDRYVNDTATEQEKAWVEDWYNAYHLKATQPLTHAEIEQITSTIESHLPQAAGGGYNKWLRIAALITGALIALTIFYFVYKHKQSQIITGKDVYKAAQRIAPGSNRATLLLNNGEVIDLSAAQVGTLTAQAGISISKTADGKLNYTVTDQGAANHYNTITTPRGGQYQVTLPDGTKVWLNAESSLTYATNYTHLNLREVTLHGEAYFEVAHNPVKPFVVQSLSQRITVLGTHFNVSSYADELTTTTLLQGKVSVNATGKPLVLEPGQQSINRNGQLEVQEADTLLAVAWKNGLIKFRNTELPVIMEQIGRWYNIDVAYEGNISRRRFTGGINRSSNLAAVLQILSESGIDFEMRQMPNGTTALLVKEK